METLAAAVKSANSAEIDAVSGAAVTSNAVKTAVGLALDQAQGKATAKADLKDGTYSVKSTGYSWTGQISAEVTIEQNQIKAVTITEEHESETGEMAQTAFDTLIRG
ncbi:MAG: FMN-binding protein [Holdemania massiliensis]